MSAVEELDRYLDAGAGAERPAGLDPALADLVDRLRALTPAEWDRVAPAPPARPQRVGAHRRPTGREVLIGVAAALAVVGLLTGVAALRGARPTSLTPTAARWRLAGLLDQRAWQVGPDAIPSETITCPTAQRCYTADPAASVVERTTDGGADWSPSTLPQSSTITTGLACPTPLDCLAGGLTPSTGGGPASTGGASGDPALPSADGGASTAPVDGAGTPIVLGTVDGGASWTVTPLPSAVTQVVDMACTSASDCVAAADTSGDPAGAAVFVTTDGGATWSPGGALPPGFLPAVDQGLACAASSCVMVGATVSGPAAPGALVSADGGASWSASPLPPQVALVTAVACPMPGSCLAVGQTAASGTGHPYGPGVVVTSADGGDTWNRSSALGLAPADVASLSCTSNADCWVAGTLLGPPSPTGYGVVASTSDGGSTWTQESLPSGADYDAVLSISCPSTCVALAAENSSLSPAVLTGG